jgi:DNA-binding transcriptional regulator YhcF (GntR family)
MNALEISELLRRRIMADVHLGRLKPGDRLPSLRTIGNELGVSIRAAARAYSELQREGLVTVRGRSGIYLVLPEVVDVSLEAPLDWYAEMLKDAWSRRISITDVTAMLEQLVANPMRAGCVESTEDHMEAFCSEISEDFALETVSIHLTPHGARVGDETMTLYDALSSVDFVVTTAFHAAEVHEVADLLQKPVVIVSVNDTLVVAIERELKERPVTIVAADPGFLQRFRESLIERFRENGELRVITVEEMLRDRSITEGTTTLLTRAARKKLNEDEYHLFPPPVAFLSVYAARKLVQCMLATHRNRVLQPA